MKEIYRYALGGFIIILFAALTFTLIFRGGYDEQVVLIIGAILGYAGSVIQHEFGSSRGSSDKNEILKKNE